MSLSKLFAGIALAFFIIATLAAAGDITAMSWAVDAGLAALAAAFLA